MSVMSDAIKSEGRIITGADGESVVQVKTSVFMKAFLTIIGALIVAASVGGFVMLLDTRGHGHAIVKLGEQVELNKEFRIRVHEQVALNTTFRLAGDRFTTDDSKMLAESFKTSVTNYSELVAQLLESTNTTNKLLIAQAETLAVIKTRLEGVEREQERARTERRELGTP